jgi:hypothetical protein
VPFGSDVLSFAIDFFGDFFTGLLRVELEVPRAMLDLVSEMESFVVAGAILPHAPEDFQPSLPQAAQSAGVALSFVAMGA